MDLLVPAGCLVVVAWWRASRSTKGVLTDERKAIYEAALKELKDPARLRRLALAFEKEGLTVEAALLRKRAALRELPPEVKRARGEAIQKALQSSDPDAVLRVAAAFESQGATGAAKRLRDHAHALRVVQTIAPVKVHEGQVVDEPKTRVEVRPEDTEASPAHGQVNGSASPSVAQAARS